MKKQILKLGKALSKREQKLICGGVDPFDGFIPDGPGGVKSVKIGVCYINGRIIKVSCDSLCPNGTDPICAM